MEIKYGFVCDAHAVLVALPPAVAAACALDRCTRAPASIEEYNADWSDMPVSVLIERYSRCRLPSPPPAPSIAAPGPLQA
jgi:hypothetical protein